MSKNVPETAVFLLQALNDAPAGFNYSSISKKYLAPNGSLYKKSELLALLNVPKVKAKIKSLSPTLTLKLRTKPIRSLSGVTPVTVLTKPYPCPGECIFCPSDIRMPKSYLSREPGAQRAATAAFDPYLQVYDRLSAFRSMGHPVAKIELLVLGGTWSVYPLSYRRWFIKRLFDALNDYAVGQDERPGLKLSLKSLIPPLTTDVGPQQVLPPLGLTYNQSIKQVYTLEKSQAETTSWAELAAVQRINETAAVRCVGLVLETRPDYVTLNEVICLRRLGATKIQLGIQSLNHRVLALNKRGHTITQAASAVNLLRLAGFKLHLHWMPNLYGSTVSDDKKDYLKLFKNLNFQPDELKIYPCSLIPGTKLVTHYEAKRWQPYDKAELSDILSFCLTNTPRYCRISRMIRDIPGHDILVGNKLTNFRQIAFSAVTQNGGVMQDIRAREIRDDVINSKEVNFKSTRYQTTNTKEYFLEYVTAKDRLVAFLRLSLPLSRNLKPFSPELENAAMIREVHVYGQSQEISLHNKGPAQHLGFGRQLIRKALEISKQSGARRLNVISAVGTREYYRRLGFKDGDLYQYYEL